MPSDNLMIHKSSEPDAETKIAVVGCGGMGCNALRSAKFPKGVQTIAIGTERREIKGTGADVEMLIDVRDAEAVAKSEFSKFASTKVENEIGFLVKDVDIVFPIAGLGGNSGGWTASLVSKVAHMNKCLAVSIVTVPFTAEGKMRKARSTKQLEALRSWSDAVIPLKNDLIIREVPDLPMLKAFGVMNSVVRTPIEKFGWFGSRGLMDLKKHFRQNHIFRMDAAGYHGDNAVFGLMEQFKSSNWLSLDMLEPKSAVVFIEDYGADEKLAHEFMQAFGQAVGHDVPAVVCLRDIKTMSRDVNACLLVGF